MNPNVSCSWNHLKGSIIILLKFFADYQANVHNASDCKTANRLPHDYELVVMLQYLLDIIPEQFPFFFMSKQEKGQVNAKDKDTVIDVIDD